MDLRRAGVVAVSVALITAAFAAEVQPPRPRSRAEVEAILKKAPLSEKDAKVSRLNIVLLADKKDHGENEHDYPLWQKRWALLIGGTNASSEKQVNMFGPAVIDEKAGLGAADVNVTTAWNWPSAEQLRTADVIVAFCYMDWKGDRVKEIESYLSRGGGLMVVHPASWTQPKPSVEVAKLFGVGGYKLYRHGPVKLKVNTQHAICLGLPETIEFFDETYWPPTPFDTNQTEVLATSDERVSKDSNDIAPQAMFWTHQYGKGRVFGCVPGHYMWIFDDPYFRILLLRGMAWAAGESPYRFDSLVLRGARLSNEQETK